MSQKNIATLLAEDPIDWRAVKERAESHPLETEPEFIHQLCLQPTVPPLFLDWALAQPYAESQLRRMSTLLEPEDMQRPIEMCFDEANQSVPYSTVERIVQASIRLDGPVHVDEDDMRAMSPTKLQLFLETYPIEKIPEVMEVFLFGPIWNEVGDHGWGEDDDTARVRLVLRAVSRLWGSERTSNGVFCFPHTFLVSLQAYLRDADGDGGLFSKDLYLTLKALLPLFRLEFEMVDDQEGNTMLHYVMQYARNNFQAPSRFGRPPDDVADNKSYGERATRYWTDMVRLLVREQHQPSRNAMLANKRGQIPFCMALTKGLPHVMELVGLSAAAGAETIMHWGLYPFQIAATATIEDSPDCDSNIKEMKDAVVVSNTYDLLRMAPHLVSSSIAENDDEDALLDCPAYKQIVMKELQMARLGRQIKIMKRRRSEGIERKRRRLMAKATEARP